MFQKLFFVVDHSGGGGGTGDGGGDINRLFKKLLELRLELLDSAERVKEARRQLGKAQSALKEAENWQQTSKGNFSTYFDRLRALSPKVAKVVRDSID